MDYQIKMTPEERNRFHGLKIWVAGLKNLRTQSEFEDFWTKLDLEVKKSIRAKILSMLDDQLELIRLEERHAICLLIATIRHNYSRQMLATWDSNTHSERLKGYREIEKIVNDYREASQERIKKEE